MINEYLQKFKEGHSIAEYLVIPKYRRNKIGKKVAFEIFDNASTTWTGVLIVRLWSAIALEIACLIQ